MNRCDFLRNGPFMVHAQRVAVQLDMIDCSLACLARVRQGCDLQ